MKFTRTSDTSIKCVISKEEIAKHGVSLSDILQKKKSSIEFIHKLVDLAAKEVGYEDVEKLNTLQMAVIQDDIVLHISENDTDPEQFKKDVLEKINQMSQQEQREFVQNHVKEISEELKKMMDVVEKKVENHTKKEARKKTRKSISLDAAEKKIREVPYMFRFGKLQELYSYISSISRDLKAESQLFKNTSGEYVLAISDKEGKADALSFGQAILKASDYGEEVSQEENYLVHLNETCECLIQKEAVEKLSQCIE